MISPRSCAGPSGAAAAGSLQGHIPQGVVPTVLNVLLIVVHLIASGLLLLFVLLHAGRGGGLSDMFGGASGGGSMAGSTVVEKNLDRITVATAIIFTFTTILLALRLETA